MEKIKFTFDNDETVEFFVLEQAKLSGNSYILVTEEEEGDSEALILKEISNEKKGDTTYEIVEDDAELEALSSLFESLLEDVDLT